MIENSIVRNDVTWKRERIKLLQESRLAVKWLIAIKPLISHILCICKRLKMFLWRHSNSTRLLCYLKVNWIASPTMMRFRRCVFCHLRKKNNSRNNRGTRSCIGRGEWMELNSMSWSIYFSLLCGQIYYWFSVVRQWLFNDSRHLRQIIDFDNSLMSFCHSVEIWYCFFPETPLYDLFCWGNVSLVSTCRCPKSSKRRHVGLQNLSSGSYS